VTDADLDALAPTDADWQRLAATKPDPKVTKVRKKEAIMPKTTTGPRSLAEHPGFAAAHGLLERPRARDRGVQERIAALRQQLGRRRLAECCAGRAISSPGMPISSWCPRFRRARVS
jgi:hypothetical protein